MYTSLSKIILLFIVWRVTLFIVAFASPSIIPDFGARFPYFEERLISSQLPHFIWSFGNFDGVHYLGIAKDAYAYNFTQVFFPFYPVLVWLLNLLIGNLLIAALLISNVAFLLGLIIFYKLISSVYSEKIAMWSTVFVLAFPTSFYFGAVYTEGIFFLMVVAAFYLAEKNRMLASSIVGSFASATRLVGLFLAPALFLKKKRNILPLLIIPIGFLAYVLYLQIEFNNPLYFITAQSIFGQERETTQIVLLPQVVYRYMKILATTEGLVLANAALELASTVFATVMLFIAWKMKVKREWLVFSAAAVLVPTLTGTFASMPRYILVAFPIYIVLAHLKSTQVKIAVIFIFLALLFATTTLFTQGYWVA